MRRSSLVRLLFLVSAAYDGVIGVLFIFAPDKVFDWIGVTPPNHPGYIQFPAALLIVFAIMFLAIAVNPARNRNLIPYGILLKVSYCSVVFYHWYSTDLPQMWKTFAICDLVMLAMFAWAYKVTKRTGR